MTTRKLPVSFSLTALGATFAHRGQFPIRFKRILAICADKNCGNLEVKINGQLLLFEVALVAGHVVPLEVDFEQMHSPPALYASADAASGPVALTFVLEV